MWIQLLIHALNTICLLSSYQKLCLHSEKLDGLRINVYLTCESAFNNENAKTSWSWLKFVAVTWLYTPRLCPSNDMSFWQRVSRWMMTIVSVVSLRFDEKQQRVSRWMMTIVSVVSLRFDEKQQRVSRWMMTIVSVVSLRFDEKQQRVSRWMMTIVSVVSLRFDEKQQRVSRWMMTIVSVVSLRFDEKQSNTYGTELWQLKCVMHIIQSVYTVL